MPGWRRVRRGRGFRYLDAAGRPLRDEAALGRIRSLAIPPAYESVWICPHPDGHVQATARDARGRKQYRYHPAWQALQGQVKFERLREFGRALPVLRARVRRDLALPGLPRAKVLAAMVRLLDTAYLRVGNDEYARTNGSYGLSTLRDRHARVRGDAVELSFRGKSGVSHRARLRDAKLARIVRRCQELPGQALFQYLDDDGTRHRVGSADVNDYLREAARGEFTAKDFRTWHASALALDRLLHCPPARGRRDAAGQVRKVIGEVAARLGHTVTVCRKAYVHDAVVEAYSAGVLNQACAALAPRGLKVREARLLALLDAGGGGGIAQPQPPLTPSTEGYGSRRGPRDASRRSARSANGPCRTPARRGSAPCRRR
jgi:DNA topoisomerase-1